MGKNILITALFCLVIGLTGCSTDKMSENAAGEKDNQKETAGTTLQQEEGAEDPVQTNKSTSDLYTVDTKISEVMKDPVFGNYGRLIFPVDERYYSGGTLGGLGLLWYSNIDPEKSLLFAMQEEGLLM